MSDVVPPVLPVQNTAIPQTQDTGKKQSTFLDVGCSWILGIFLFLVGASLFNLLVSSAYYFVWPKPDVQLISHNVVVSPFSANIFAGRYRNSGGAGNVYLKYEDKKGQTLSVGPCHFDKNEERLIRFEIPASIFDKSDSFSVNVEIESNRGLWNWLVHR